MKKALTIIHRWLGFPLGLLFLLTFGTGCLTAVDELLERVNHSRENAFYSYRNTTFEENSKVIGSIIQGKKNIRQLTMPTVDTPYYRISARGENWVYPIDYVDDLDQIKEVHSQTNSEGFFRTVLQLHRNFLLGKDGFLGIEGKYYAAWVGLTALLISVLGLWLWWPLRKTFAVKDILLQGKKRKNFYYNHMTGGVVVLVVIVLMGLTGASITYRTITQQLFGVERDKLPVMQAIQLDNNWGAWLSGAYAQMPDGATLQKIRFPRKNRGGRGKQTLNNKPREKTQKILEFRFQAKGDWFGLSGSKVQIDQKTSTLINVVLFRDLPLNEKIYAILVPLHTGHNLSFMYVVVLLVLSLIGTMMMFSGLLSFVIKKRKWQKKLRFKIGSVRGFAIKQTR